MAEDNELTGGTPTPQPEPTPEPIPQPESTPAPEPQPQRDPPRDWRDRQIMSRDERIANMQRQLESVQAELAAARQQQPTAPAYDEAEFNRRVDVAAREKAVQQNFQDRCNDAATQGRELYPDFNDRVSSLLRLVNRGDPVSEGAYANLISAALETGRAPELVHRLGSDLNEADRFLSMSPTKMAVELTKLAAGLPERRSANRQSPVDEQDGQQTGAPPPIRPVGGRGVSHQAIDPSDPDRSDNLSTAEFMRRREMQIAARDRGEAA